MSSARAASVLPLDAPRRPLRCTRRPIALLALAVIEVGALGLMVWAARTDSVTIDEFAHLPAGIFYLRTGHFNVYNLSPPLLRMIDALPAWWAGADADFARFIESPDHWQLGYDFMQRNAVRYHALFVRGRLPTVGLTLALIALLFAYGGEHFGTAAGLAAAALAACCPNILAHGHLVTTDLGFTLAFCASVFAYERALRTPRMSHLVIAGVALGLALLTKFTALLLLPITAVLTAVGMGSYRRAWARWLFVAVLGVFVVNVGYGFSGTGTPLVQYDLRTAGLQRLAAGPFGRLPLPLPRDFVAGFDLQSQEANGQYPAFFHGQLSTTGWWYYYLAALGLKTPLPTLVLLIAGVGVGCARGMWRTDRLTTAVLLLTPVLYLVSFSLLTDINIGVRYVLPVFPFLFLIGASVLRDDGGRPRLARLGVAAVLACNLYSALSTAPCFLSYFNVLAGGSAGGYRWLIDSNLDWGQDLVRLRQYLAAHGGPRVRLAYFGRVAPEIYGIDYEMIAPELVPAVYVVSASFLMGRPYLVYDHGALYWAPANLFTRFQRLRPTAVIGNALFVFDLRPTQNSTRQ